MKVLHHAATQRQEPLSSAALLVISVAGMVSVIPRLAMLGKVVIIWADAPILA